MPGPPGGEVLLFALRGHEPGLRGIGEHLGEALLKCLDALPQVHLHARDVPLQALGAESHALTELVELLTERLET